MNNQELWEAALAEIEVSISKANFLTWFKNTSLISKNDGVAVLAVPNAFTKEWLENKYNRLVLRSLRNKDNDIKDIEFIIRSQAKEKIKAAQKKEEEAILETQLDFSEAETDKETNLNKKYTFDSFVVGSSNELAHAAALAIVEDLGNTYNPLFLYGGVGLGKTHLLQAIGNSVHNDRSGSVRYVVSERFTQELISAIQKGNSMAAFKEKYREIDLLIIDDIQFISGKEKTQEEFFHTFNSLYEKNKQIILSSDRPPKAIPTLEERLRSRFEGGMIADISAPDFETRLAILKKKAVERQIDVGDEILELIATAVTTNIRELEGSLNRIIATTRLTGEAPSKKKVKSLLETNKKQARSKITAKTIIKVVSDFYDVGVDDLINKSRKRQIVYPRQISMYLIRKELENSYPYIGDKFGGRDHTTVMHACDKIEKELKKNETLVEEINIIKSRLFNSA